MIGYLMTLFLDIGVVELRRRQGELDVLLGEHDGLSMPERASTLCMLPLKQQIVISAQRLVDYERYLERMFGDIYLAIEREDSTLRWLTEGLGALWRERRKDCQLCQQSLNQANDMAPMFDQMFKVRWWLVLLAGDSEDGLVA